MESSEMNPSRRRVLQTAAALGFAGAALPMGVIDAVAQGRQIKGHVPAAVPTERQLGRWLRQLHDFGPIRDTGTARSRAFEEFLADEFEGLGCTVERDEFRLTSWECDIRDCSITVREDGGRSRNLEVIAYFPFAASTRGTGPVTGRVLFAQADGNGAGEAIIAAHSAEELAQSIVVINMPLQGGGIRGTVTFHEEYSFPNPRPPLARAPRIASQGGGGPMAALENRCKGLILCYNDVSDEAARHNYLPFSQPHRKIPALWVGKRGSDYLKSVSGKASVSLECRAMLTPNARTDSLMAVKAGASEEVVYMTTHTDGPNEVNDNGGLGLLACATYFSKAPHRRTMAYSLPTGHYAGGAIRDAVTGSGRASGTSGNFAKWPALLERAVAQMALEQMGAMEWADENLRWQAMGRPAPEHWIPTPNTDAKPNQVAAVGKMLLASTSGLDPKWSRTGLVISGQAPGEGGGLRSRGIPGIGLMGSPHYFFRADPKGVLSKLSPKVMYNQVMMATRMLVMFDRLTPAQLKGDAPISDGDLFA